VGQEGVRGRELAEGTHRTVANDPVGGLGGRINGGGLVAHKDTSTLIEL
jgi:hypothetical protein